ncbi:hypothetical protein MJO28_012216 [Puccinia striiformis f. sp. tritici]|uniref:Uncharacterized protein n=1 Tax=Puccinia striiformis f. sp. tritici TaxID=168172 RepID=A0ACC0DZA0_9BASI|nr:hypothetical protein MJO28_012216 [Puccinia striiformis f. sp. tritici]
MFNPPKRDCTSQDTSGKLF